MWGLPEVHGHGQDSTWWEGGREEEEVCAAALMLQVDANSDDNDEKSRGEGVQCPLSVYRAH